MRYLGFSLQRGLAQAVPLIVGMLWAILRAVSAKMGMKEDVDSV
jgi:hypothetical protein